MFGKSTVRTQYLENGCVCMLGKKKMNVNYSVHQELSYSSLRKLSSCYCNQVGAVNHSILPIIQIGVLPQNILNWKLGMEKNSFNDKTEHMLFSAANNHGSTHVREFCLNEYN